MKKIILSAGVFCTIFTFAQTGNVGIDTSTPNPDAVLDVVSTTKGILNPRVALQSTTLAAPLSAHVAGMVVYNTATTGDVVPALYYNDGTKWVKSGGGGSSAANPPMNVTNQTGSYTALATDDIILFSLPSGTSPYPVLTLPTTGIPIGKMIFVSVIRTGGTIETALITNPQVRETATIYLWSSQGHILMYTGNAASPWSLISGY